MSDQRSYDDPCGIARALDVVGERWTLLVVRELILGPKRFVDLRSGLGKLSANVLTQRLRELEAHGLVTRRTMPTPGGMNVYALTERGHQLEPILLALGRFGREQPMPPDAMPLGVDAVILALPTTFDPGTAPDFVGDVRLRLHDHPFLCSVRDGRLHVARDDHTPAGSDLVTDPSTLARVLWHGGRLADAERDGRARTHGDRAMLGQFMKLFPPPDA